MNALNKREFSLSLQYPIEFNYDQEAFVAVQPLPRNIKVNVTGNGWSLLQKSWLSLRAHPVSYTINSPSITTVLNSSALIDEIVESLPGLKVNHVVADTFELSFEKKLNKVVHVRVDSAAIDLREGYVISSFVNVSPSLIMLEGPASAISTYPDTLWVQVPDTKIQNNYDESILLPLSLKPHVQASHVETFVSFEVARYLLEN